MASGKADAAISIDVGGTSAKWALVSHFGILQRGSFPTGRDCTAETLLGKIRTCVQTALQNDTVSVGHIAVCLPGVVGSDGIVREGAPNLPCIVDLDFAAALSMFSVPVAVFNDANAAAVGEAAMGAARGQKDFLFLIYGTGIGGALVLDGKLRSGFHGFSGEIGYSDFQNGTIAEARLSTLALIGAASDAVGKETDGRAFFENLEKEPLLERLLHTWIEGNARLIANALLVVDVPLVVIGGGISAQGARLTDALQSSVREKLPRAMRDVRIVPARLGNDAALYSGIL